MTNKVFIICGQQGSGKTTFLTKLVDEIKNKDLQVGGFVAEGFWKENHRDKFELVDLKSGKKIVYCQRDPLPGWEQIRHFYINPLAIDFGESVLNLSQLDTADLVVIDEIGPFEIAGKGWAKSLDQILQVTDLPLLISVRQSLLEQVVKYFQLEVKEVFEVPGSTIDYASECVLASI